MLCNVASPLSAADHIFLETHQPGFLVTPTANSLDQHDLCCQQTCVVVLQLPPHSPFFFRGRLRHNVGTNCDTEDGSDGAPLATCRASCSMSVHHLVLARGRSVLYFFGQPFVSLARCSCPPPPPSEHIPLNSCFTFNVSATSLSSSIPSTTLF